MQEADMLRGGETLAAALRENGVSVAFSLAGTAHTYLLAAMDRLGGFRVVSTRHETCTVLAADGYSRVTGKVGVALIKNDQGLPNAMTGICTANAACSPVVVISSLSPASSLEAGGERDGDLAMAATAAKWVRVVPSADRMAEYVNMAVRQATTGRPGVAVLGIPQEFQNTLVPAALPPTHRPLAAPAPDPAALDNIAALLRTARRPLILAGRGACAADGGAALRELATAYQIPVMGNSLGRGIVAEDNRLGFSWPLAQVAAAKADLILAFGIRMTQRLGYGLSPRFAKTAPFVQIDIHAEELGRNRPVDLGIHADAAATAQALHRLLDRNGLTPFSEPHWIGEAIAPRCARIDEIGHDGTGEIHPYAIGRALARALPPDAVLVGDGADILNWLHGVYSVASPRCYMDHYPFGSMGVGTGLALGAGIALAEEAGTRPPRPLVLLTGDGAFGFYCGELHSFAAAGVKVTVIVANDGAWGTEHHGQLRALGTSFNCLLGKSDYHHIGEAFGFDAVKVEHPSDLKAALERALAGDRSAILNVLTDTDAGRVRKTDPRVQTIAFEDLASSLKTHHTPEVA